MAFTYRAELFLPSGMGAASGWVTNEDVRRDQDIAWDGGISGDDPDSNVADIGTLTLGLDNSEYNSQGKIGLYSPGHVNCLPGFELGTKIRLIFNDGVDDYVRFTGKISDINPLVGTEGEKRTDVSAVDYMFDMSNTFLREVPVQVEKRADELLDVVMDEMAEAPPGGTLFDEGSDIYPFAMDTVAGQSAVAEAKRICDSERGLFAIMGSGTARFLNRSARLFGSSGPSPILTVTKPHALDVRWNLDSIINKVRFTVVPRDVDDEPIVLAQLVERVPVPPGQTITVITDYRNPENPEEPLAATGVVVPLEAGRDYNGSAEEAVIAGTPSIPYTAVPAAFGTYNNSTGTIASLSDGSAATGLVPNSVGTKTSVTFGAVPDADSSAPVSSVVFSGIVDHNGSSSTDFFVLYLYLLLNGVETLLGVVSGYTLGSNPFSFTPASPPGGGNWTVGALNSCELIAVWNLGGPTVENPILAEVQRDSLHVGGTLVHDRTSDISISTTAGSTSATHLVTNSNALETVYVWLQVRGRGMYQSGAINVDLQSDASIARYKVKREQSYDAPYQDSQERARSFGAYVLSQRKDPYGRVQNLTLIAEWLHGIGNAYVDAATQLDFNSLIRIEDPVTAVAAYFWVNKLSGTISGESIVTLILELARADEQTYFTIGVSSIGGPDAIAPF